MKHVFLWCMVSSIASIVTSQGCSPIQGAYDCSNVCDACNNIDGQKITVSYEKPEPEPITIINRSRELCETFTSIDKPDPWLPVKIESEDEHEFLRGNLCSGIDITLFYKNVLTSGFVMIKEEILWKKFPVDDKVSVTWLGWDLQTSVDWVTEWVILDVNGEEFEPVEVPPGNFSVVLMGDKYGECGDCVKRCPLGGDAYLTWGLLPAEATTHHLSSGSGILELWNTCQMITETNDTTTSSSTSTTTTPKTTASTTTTSTMTSTSTTISTEPSTLITETSYTTTDPSISTSTSKTKSTTQTTVNSTSPSSTSSTSETHTKISTTTSSTTISSCCCQDDEVKVCQGEVSEVPCPSEYTGHKFITCSAECTTYEVENTCIAKWINDSKHQIENGQHTGLEIAQGIENNTLIYQNLSSNDMNTLIPMLTNLTELMDQQVSEASEEVELKLIEYVGTLINITDNLLRGDDSWINLNQTERASLGPDLLLELESSSFLLARNIDLNKTFCQTWRREFVQLLKIQVQTIWQDDVIFPEKNNGSYIHLPQRILQDSSEGRLVGLILRSDAASKIGPPTANIFSNDHKVLNSPLVSVTLNRPGHSTNTTQGEEVTMVFLHQALESGASFRDLYRNKRPNEVPTPVPRTADCVFWNMQKSKWSNEGCQLVQTNVSETHCRCNHLTMFAIITDMHGYLGRDKALDILGSVLCSASVISLFTALILLHFCQKRNSSVSTGGTNPRTTITKQLCVSMGLFHFLLLLLLDRDLLKLDETSCMISGMILHYLGLATVFWMLAEGMHLYQRVVNVLSPTILLPVYWFLGYGVPLVIVVSTITAAYGSSQVPWVEQEAYAFDEYCWLDPEYGYLWAFTGPLIAVIVANTISMLLALRSAAIVEVNRKKSLPQHLRLWVRGVFSLNCILGISWVFGLMYIEANHALAYVFTILNGSQGVMLLILHCLVNDNIRQMLSSKMPCCQTNKHSRKSTAYHPSEYGRSSRHPNTNKQSDAGHSRSILSSIISKTKYKSSNCKKHQEDELRRPNIIKNVEVTKVANADGKETKHESYHEKTEDMHIRSGHANVQLDLHIDLDVANSIANECHNCQQGYNEKCNQSCKYSYSPPALKHSPSFTQYRQRLNRGGSNWSQDTQLTNMSNLSEDNCSGSRKDSMESLGSNEESPLGSTSGSPSLSKASTGSSASSSHKWEHSTGCYDNPRFDPSCNNSRFEHPACYDNPRFIPEFGSIPECYEKSPSSENNVQFFK